MNRTHRIARAAARAAMDECFAYYGGKAGNHIHNTVGAYLRLAGVSVKHNWDALPDGLSSPNTTAVLDDGALVNVDLEEKRVAIVAI